MNIGNFDTCKVSLHTTVALWVFAGVTVVLGIYSAVCPPQGVIDKSVLEFGCLMAGFATLAIGRETEYYARPWEKEAYNTEYKILKAIR